MKKVLALMLTLSIAVGLLVPSTAYAKDKDDGEKYAIVIGISDYPGPLSVLEDGLDLFYADDDATAVSETLIGVYGIKSENVITLIDQSATRSGILGAVANLSANLTKKEEVVFFYSGHVLRLDQVIGLPNVSDTVGMLVWGDNNASPDFIWDYELKAAFAQIKTNQVTFVFDACSSKGFSELAARGRTVISATDEDGISGEIGIAYAEMFGALLPAEYQYLLDANHGLFTYFFFVVGIQYGMGDTNDDGVVNFKEAFRFTAPILRNFTAFAQSLGFPLDEVPVLIGNNGRDISN